MATYKPPYPPKVKESVNVDFKDRWTAQKVKFINRENEFYGTFYGNLNISATNVSGLTIDNSDFVNGRIGNSTLSNSFILTKDGKKIGFDSIISTQNQIKGNVNDLCGKIDGFDKKFDDYYKKTETSSRTELTSEFGNVYKKIDEINISNDLSDYYKKSETSSSSELECKFDSVNENLKQLGIDSNNYADTKIQLFQGSTSKPYSTNLSVVKLTNEEYNKLVVDDKINQSALYVINDDFLDARGQQVRNVAKPSSYSDVATKGYVDDDYYSKSEICSMISVSLSALKNPIDELTIEQVVSALYNLRSMFVSPN